jgi:hypothetical protein
MEVLIAFIREKSNENRKTGSKISIKPSRISSILKIEIVQNFLYRY